MTNWGGAAASGRRVIHGVIWYLGSLADGDTHLGDWQPDGFVITRCGLRFELAACNYPGLPGEPSGPLQICNACRSPAIIMVGNRADAC